MKTCTECGHEEEEVIDVLDHVHQTTVIPAKAATCSSVGNTEGSYCSKCEEVFVEQQYIPMDHSFVNGECKYCGTTDKPSAGFEMELTIKVFRS